MNSEFKRKRGRPPGINSVRKQIDEHRKNLWKENLIDKIVAVKYNARIKNKAGEESLFLPIFVEIRDDKDVADKSKDIK
jgi:hypothetical protein